MTTLPDEKTPASEIERTQVLLQDRKRIALASPEVVRRKKSVKTKGASDDGKGAIKGT